MASLQRQALAVSQSLPAEHEQPASPENALNSLARATLPEAPLSLPQMIDRLAPALDSLSTDQRFLEMAKGLVTAARRYEGRGDILHMLPGSVQEFGRALGSHQEEVAAMLASYEALGRIAFLGAIFVRDEFLAREVAPLLAAADRLPRSLYQKIQGFVARHILGPESPIAELLSREVDRRNTAAESKFLAGILGVLLDNSARGGISAVLDFLLKQGDARWQALDNLHSRGVPRKEKKFLLQCVTERASEFVHEQERAQREQARIAAEVQLQDLAVRVEEVRAKTRQEIARAVVARAELAKDRAELEKHAEALRAETEGKKAAAVVAHTELAREKAARAGKELDAQALQLAIRYEQIKQGSAPTKLEPLPKGVPEAQEILKRAPVQVDDDGVIHIHHLRSKMEVARETVGAKERDLTWMVRDRVGYEKARADWEKRCKLLEAQGMKVEVPLTIGRKLFEDNAFPRDCFQPRGASLLITLWPGSTFSEDGWGAGGFHIRDGGFVTEGSDNVGYQVLLLGLEHMQGKPVPRVP